MAVKRKPREPWELPHGFPADWSPEIAAMQAFEQGAADEYQQRAVWKFIVNILCNTDGMTFQPGGHDADRASAFAEGKRWIGRQFRLIARLKPKGHDERGEPPPMPGQKPE